MDIANLVQTVLIYAIPVLFAITVHEAAHGYAARHFGDDTAYVMGRITLNPIKHIDPVGTILLPLMLYFATAGIPGGPYPFGYAKPVPVRFGNLRNPKQDMVWVALAGPKANLAQALIWGALLVGMEGVGITEPYFLKMAIGGIVVNIAMFALNLFPLPPLDGGRILVGLLPYRQAELVSRIEPWGFFIVMGLIVARVLDSLWMQPVMALTKSFISLVLTPLAMLLN